MSDATGENGTDQSLTVPEPIDQVADDLVPAEAGSSGAEPGEAVGSDDVIDFADLVRANDALEWLTPQLGSRTGAKRELADRMRDGKLRSFAIRAWDSVDRAMVKAWSADPDEDDDNTKLEQDIELATWVWRRSRQWHADQADWRWPSGRFTSVIGFKPFKRILAENVHFDASEILQLAAELAVKTPKLPAPPRAGEARSLSVEGDASSAECGDRDSVGSVSLHDPVDGSWSNISKSVEPGRHVRGHAWAAVFLKLAELKATGQLDGGAYSMKKQLVSDLMAASETYEGGLKEGSIDPLVSKLIEVGFVKTSRKRRVLPD